MRIAAFDPGLTGGAAIIDANGGQIVVLSAIDLPTCEDGSNRQIDGGALCEWIDQFSPDRAVMENVQPMPSIPGAGGLRRSMGATSAFRFGFAVGQLRGILMAYGLNPKLVVPRVWKKYFGLSGPDKEQSRQCALRLVLSSEPYLLRKKDHGRAEAILLGMWAADQWGML